MTPTARRSQMVTSHGTGHSWRESVNLSHDRPDLKFESMQVCCAMAKPTTRDVEPVKRIGRYLVGTPTARCWFHWQESGELEAYSDADWGGDKATRSSVSAGVIVRGRHCLKVYTKKQQVVALSSAENLHLDASATLIVVNRRGLGKAKHVDIQSLWIQEASKPNRFATKKIGTNVNPADLMTKPLTKQKIEQLMSIHGLRILGEGQESVEESADESEMTCSRRWT